MCKVGADLLEEDVLALGEEVAILPAPVIPHVTTARGLSAA